MAVEGISTFRQFSVGTNFHQSVAARQTNNATANSSQKKHVPLPSKSEKNYTSPIVTGAIALAALGSGIYAHKTGKLQNIIKAKTPKLNQKINDIIKNSLQKANEVISENTKNGIVELPVIDNAAGVWSTSNRPEKFHEAATWLEEAYKSAYSKAKLEDGKNMFNYIHEYMNGGHTALAQMYVQMPEQEAAIRINKFITDIGELDKHTGMTAEEFVNALNNKFMPQAREAIK